MSRISNTVRLLHVDDDPGFADMAATFLEREDDRFEVETVTDANEGLNRITAGDFDCVVSDYDMPDQDGIEFLEEVRGEYPDLPFLLYTGKGSEEIASEAITAGVTDYLQKESGTSHYSLLANRIKNAVEKHRTRIELSDRNQRLDLFFEQSPLGVIEWDDHFDFVRMNSAAEDILGYSEDDLRGRSWEKIVPSSDQDAVEDVVSDLLEKEGGHHSVNKNIRKDGECIVCEWHNRIVTDDGGDVVAIFSQFQDITERNERERELERMREFFREAERLGDMGVWELDGSGEVFWTEGAKRIHGIGEDHELTVESAFELIHPDDRDHVRQVFEAALESGDPYDLELQIVTPEGNERWVHNRGKPVESDGPGQAFRGFLQDITERKERERKLDLIQTLFKHAQECQFIVDVADGEFELRHANDYYKRTVGLSPGEPVDGQTPTELFGDTVGREIIARYRGCVDTRESVTYTVEVPVPEEGITYQTILTPIVTDDTVTHIVGTARDITDYKRREAKLQRQNDQLEEFADVVSHDLRNPLRVAAGRVELMQEECESGHVEDVAQALARMDALIEDLLTLARHGEDIGEREPIDLDGFVETCWRNVETGDGAVEVVVGSRIEANRSRLGQLFENLMRNAVEHGGDDVTVTVGELDDGFYIEDDGPGIKVADRDAVFDPGYSTLEDGTGFGLSIVKQVAEAHGWEVSLTDGSTGGARFEFTGVGLSE